MQYWLDSACLDDGSGQVLNSRAIGLAVDALADRLCNHTPGAPLALAGDNSTAWIIADLAAAKAGRAVVPVPGFFTRGQIEHVCAQAGITQVLINGDIRSVDQVWSGLFDAGAPERGDAPATLPAGTQKITFTSGTTGQPKGICLTWEQQQLTARSLVQRLSALQIKVHLNLLPLAVLLENIAGVHAPLAMGMRVVTPSLSDVGLKGSSEFDARACLRAIEKHGAQSIILLPQMLHAMVGAIHADNTLLSAVRTLKFVAVGGAPTPMAVLDAARRMGLPVYEGYGLTECASVCCLNGPDADMPGTVGTPLPGLSVGLTEDGEVWVEGRSFAGVLGQAATKTMTAGGTTAHDANDAAPDRQGGSRFLTGDIGRWLEKDGQRFLQIIGRRKHVLITSFGRNVSPEWPERLLMDSGLFRQVVVLGDGQAHLRAVMVPAVASDRRAEIQTMVERANAALPDYAQVRDWCISEQPFTYANGLATANGRPLRQRIEHAFADAFKA